MLKWFGSDDAGSPGAGEGGASSSSLLEVSERLAQMEQLVPQLKEMIREKDAALLAKDEQLKAEKEACEAKLSKMRLQSKAKVTSLNSQLEELRKQQGEPVSKGTSPQFKRTGSGESGDSENSGANRGKILLLRKKVEDLDQQLTQRTQELQLKVQELEAQRERGVQMDAMLVEKDKRLAEKEDYIVHLQMGLGGEKPVKEAELITQEQGEASVQDLQALLKKLMKKVGDGEEQYSLLREQNQSLTELLETEKAQFEQRETMYKQNIQTFKEIILEKDNRLSELNRQHEQELFKLAAKSDASSDLEQLLKALKQKLHEKEEVLLGKTQVIDVLQGEVDGRDQQISELNERLRRLHSEKEDLQSKMDAEKHIMRTQVRDLMEKHQDEVKKVTEKYERELSEKEMMSSATPGSGADPSMKQRVSELEAEVKLKAEEANKSEAKFLKMKAWSKSRVRQLEDELKKAQSGGVTPDVSALRGRVNELEEEREELLCKVEQYEDLRAKNDVLEAKLVVYEEQQRKLQADLEQITKRAASQTSESGSIDDAHSQVMEWQEMMSMVAEAEAARDQIREEKTALEIRMSHIEEEREALANRQRELEEELSQVKGLRPQKCKKTGSSASRSLQEDFEMDAGSSFPESHEPSGSVTPMEGENMGEGLRSVVDELELERNRLQEQILVLEERCQDLEDRLQLQARIESLQSECERLQVQLSGLRSQQSRDAEKHQLLVTSLNEQLKGLSSTQESLESSLMEKEQTLAQTSEKLELIGSLREALREKEDQHRDACDKLLQAEQSLAEAMKKGTAFEKQSSELKATVTDKLQKLTLLKEKTQKQEATIESLQTDLDQTNDELDKLNTTHLEERAQLIHDLQRREREIDTLRDAISDRDKEISALSGNLAEYIEQIIELKQEIKQKEEELVHMESALAKAEQEAQIIRESQSSDQHSLNAKLAELTERLRVTEGELSEENKDREAKRNELKELEKQAETDALTIQDLRAEIQKLSATHRCHLSECETQISSLKEQMVAAGQRLEESKDVLEHLEETRSSNEKLKEQIVAREQTYEKEVKSLKEERNQLLAEVTKRDGELEAQVQRQEEVNRGLEEKLEAMMMLENKLRNAEEKKQKLEKRFEADKTRLEETLDAIRAQVQDLAEENHVLKQELETKAQISEEKDALLSKVAGLETQNADNLKLTDELKVRVAELEQDRRSLSETTSECSRLRASLELSEETVSRLQSQYEALSARVEQLNCEIAEKDRALDERTTEMESRQGQISRLEETLKTELMEKDKVLQDRASSLESELTKHRDLSSELRVECGSLSEKLQEREVACQNFKEQLDQRNESIAALEAENAGVKNSLESMVAANAKLSQEISQRQNDILGLQGHLQALVGQNQELRALYDSKEKELADVRQAASEMDKKNAEMLENKAEQCSHLQKELTEVTEEKNSLGEKISGLEMQHLENRKIIESLLKDKDELSRGIEQNRESLLEKTNECESLSKQVREAEESLQRLKEQATQSTSQFSQSAAEKDQVISDQRQQIESFQAQLSQLQETLSLLQEQGTALKSGLMQKDAMVQQQKDLLMHLQSENETLKEEQSRLSRVLAERESECRGHSDELSKRNEALVSLSSQLGEMNENIAKLHSDNEGCLMESAKLGEELSQKQAELVNLQDTVQALREVNDRIKAELQNALAEASRKQEELGAVQTRLSSKEVELASLTQQLGTKSLEMESLQLELRQNQESLKQQETFLNQFQARFESSEDQISQKTDAIADLQREAQSLQRALQEKDVLLLKKDQEIARLGEQIRADSDASRARATSDMDVISKLQAELQVWLEKTDLLTLSVDEKDKLLKEEAEKHLNTKAAMEDAVSKLKSEIQNLSPEMKQLRESLAQKEQTLLEAEAKHSSEIRSLSETLDSKVQESDNLRQQVADLQESVSELNKKLEEQSSEITKLINKSGSAVEDQKKAVQDLQAKADEAALFKSQFMESAELVSELQSQIQGLKDESARLLVAIEEKQSALINLQDKFASQVEDLRQSRSLLSQRNEELLNLNQMISERDGQIFNLNQDLASMQTEIRQLKEFTTDASKRKDEELAAQQMNAGSLTVEIERLKAQHLQVAAQVDSLTENLEQREMALHAINSQYTAQVKHTEQVVSEMRKLDELCRKLQEEKVLTKQELESANNERKLKEEEVLKLALEKEELSRNHNCEIQSMQEHLQVQSQLQSGSVEKMKGEAEQLQVQVSAKDDLITGLKSEVQRIEQTLQESEKEWLSVLDRETQAKNVLAEQLQGIQNELLSKDNKVHALKQDLDHLNEKLAEATLAIKQGSEKIREKELEAVGSRSKLEEILATVHAKDSENFELKQALHDMESRLKSLEESQECAQKDASLLSRSMSDKVGAFEEERVALQATIKLLQEDNESLVCSLKEELEQKQAESGDQIALLSESIKELQERLRTESENLKEATLKQGALINEIQKKDDEMSCMRLQNTQQKELLSSFSQQLKTKDDSLTQVVTSASSERVTYEEQIDSLLSQLEEAKEHLFSCRSQMESAESENKALVKGNDELKSELSKIVKDKEALKKKLQAALVVRKELLKKIEEHEKQRAENGVEPEMVSELSHQIQEKENKIQELTLVISEKEQTVRQMEESLKEQEANLSSTVQKLDESRCLIDQLQITTREKEAAFETEKLALLARLEPIEDDVKMKNESARSETGTIEELERELAKVKQEKSGLQKKAHAALLARKESIKKCQETEKQLSEIRKDYETLQEKHSQQTPEIAAVQSSYDLKLQELEGALQSAKEETEALKCDNEEKERAVEDLRVSKQEASRLHDELERLKQSLNETTFELAHKDELLVKLEEQAKEMSEKMTFTRSELDEKNEEIAEQKAKLETAEQQLEQFREDLRILQLEHQNQLDVLNETQTSSSPIDETDGLKRSLEQANSELDHKDELLMKMEKLLKETTEELAHERSELSEKNEEILRQKSCIEMTEKQLEQLREDTAKLQSDHQSTLAELQFSLSEAESRKRKVDDLQSEIERLVKERDLLKTESALQLEAQKSDELQGVKNELTVTQHQASREIQDVRSEAERMKVQIEALQREKESCLVRLEESRHDLVQLESLLVQLEGQNKELLSKTPEQEPFVQAESFKVQESQFKDSSSTVTELQSLLSEKEELISALEQQLQRQVHLHEVEMEKMRLEVSERQWKAPEVGENKSVGQLTKKLQAALISRKELMKQNQALEEEKQKLQSQNEQMQSEVTSLESTLSELKGQRADLEKSVSTLGSEKQNLVGEVNRIMSDNHSLSAACESLKLTIENITQQKQAFSCQLESLKDSQTEELSEWKSKHADLKQEYESLLQAYENVSSEMDKMRQLVEGAKRERQEALLKTHKQESERDGLVRQVAELEEENDKMKEKMRKFAKVKQQKIEELEAENEKIRKDLVSFEDDHKSSVAELMLRNGELENEIKSLQELSEELRAKMSELQEENQNVALELKETLEKWHKGSNETENNLQLRLEDALHMKDEMEALKAESAAQVERLQRENAGLSENLKQAEHELRQRVRAIAELRHVIEENAQEAISLSEKVRILEDDKCMLQEELENVQETSEKVKNENEYLETVLLKNSESIDEMTEGMTVLQTQNMLIAAQLKEVKEDKAKACQEKEKQHLKLVKEFEEKLKTLQRGTEGSKNMKKELQELLKEKHQEINQLQQDCIKYQELILNLERSLKNAETEHKQVVQELRDVTEKIGDLRKERENLEDELKSYKNNLNEARRELSRVSAERDRLQQELVERQRRSEYESAEMDRSLEKMAEQQQALLKEQRVELQKQISDLLEESKRDTNIIVSLQKQVESKDVQIKTLQREAETGLAKLALFSVDPNSADAAKQWDDVFQKALRGKDSQLHEQNLVITQLTEDNRVKTRALNEMQIANKKLERTANEYSVAASAHQRQLFVVGASNTELNQKLEILTKRSLDQSALIETLQSDKSTLAKQLDELTYSASQTKSGFERLKETLAERESELRLAQEQCSKLVVDLERQEAISLHLKSLVQNKDAEISSLLSSKDGQLSGYLEQLQASHRAQLSGYEDRLSALYARREGDEKELKTLQNKVKSLQAKLDRSAEEKEEMSRQTDALRRSVQTSQAEKEHLSLELKQMKEINEDLSAESASKGLKQEIKTLLNQMDDLNSENAMLKAQLIRYREDLNQVLSLKDNQLKDLLKKQQDSIRNLENEKRLVETQLRDALRELQRTKEELEALRTEEAKLQSQVEELEDSLLALHKEKLETDESKVIADLQQAIAAKASECNDLQQKLLGQKVATDEAKKSLKETLREAEKKLGEAEEKYNQELDAFERDVNLMRNQRETADQRVADLAKELMQAEQDLLEAKNLNKSLTSQNESLGKAMAALQNDRDQLIDDFKVLRSRYEEELRESMASVTKFEHQLNDATSDLSAMTAEKNVLIRKLVALESKDPHSNLSALVGELSRDLSEKEAALSRVSLEKNSYSRQMHAFSKSMVSLQSDRDRLMEELRRTKKESESRQRTSPDTVPSSKSDESSFSISPLQTDRAGLMKDAVSLRSQNNELLELQQKYVDQQRALQQAQSQKQQCDKDIAGYQAELRELRSEKSRLQSECQALRQTCKESVSIAGKGISSEQAIQLQTHLQHCLVEIQQRDLNFQQLNIKLQQSLEEKATFSTQLRTVSQTLRETQLSLSELQNRYYWLQNQSQNSPAQDSTCVEVAPGAPQEISSAATDLDGLDLRDLRSRLSEAELQLDSAQQNMSLLNDRLEEERGRRQAAEEALGLAEQRISSMEPSPSRASRDFSIQLENEDEWESLTLDPNQPLLMRTMRSGVHSCRRWLRGRSLYCTKMLTSRAKSRYFFMGYLLTLHVLVLMCLTGAL